MQIKSSKKTTLLALLGELSPESSKNTLRSWIDKGRVFVDGLLAKRADQSINQGQEISIGTKPKFLRKNLKIVFEDDDLVVIDKPAGLLSVATDVEMETSAHALLKRRYNRPTVYPIHRLDKDTSGLLIFAYTKEARDDLKEQLKNRSMYREYRALVHGHPGEGTWKNDLYEDKALRVHVCPPGDGKEAITHFETLEKRGERSFLKLRLESGRKHQIRVQAAHAGFPIVGDSKYGLEEDAKKPFQLRAVALTFTHPSTKKLHTFKII